MNGCSLKLLIAMPLLLCAGFLNPAAAEAPTLAPYANLPNPSRLDYVVLASIADSSNLLSMSGYYYAKR